MGLSVSDKRYRINGLVDTGRSVIENLTDICSSAGAWLTYDTNEGKWAVIINREGDPTRYFDDSNIMGAIELTGTSLREFFNGVKVTFPRSDIRDQLDFIKISIPEVDRNPNEIDNVLEINYSFVSDPVQAELLGLIELKQTRIDRMIRFQTDWSQLGIKAGDIISVTAQNYGFINTEFRVVSVSESGDDSGGIVLDIMAMGYSDSIYDEDLFRYERSTSTGIVSLNSIGTPATPQITAIAADARPRLVLEATVPTGIVEGLEFWLSTDGTNYSMVSRELPPTGSTFTSGESVVYDHDVVGSNDYYLKVRGMNGSVTGPFSPVYQVLEYVPVQTAAAIDANTDVKDEEGDSLLGLTGLNLLLYALRQVVDDGDSNSTLYQGIFNTFNQETGADLRQTFAGSATSQSTVDADWIILTYTFTNGSDLDTRTFFGYPNVGQYTLDDYIGYTSDMPDGSSTSQWPKTGTGYAFWGGDNTGTGNETVLIDVNAFKAANPGVNLMKINCYAAWYTTGTVGSNPVTLTVDVYKGGTPSLSNYTWTVSGYTAAANLASNSTYVYTQGDGTILGDFLGTVNYQLSNTTTNFDYSAAGAVSRLSNLNDVKIVNPQNGDYLMWNGSYWINFNPGGVGPGADTAQADPGYVLWEITYTIEGGVITGVASWTQVMIETVAEGTPGAVLVPNNVVIDLNTQTLDIIDGLWAIPQASGDPTRREIAYGYDGSHITVTAGDIPIYDTSDAGWFTLASVGESGDTPISIPITWEVGWFSGDPAPYVSGETAGYQVMAYTSDPGIAGAIQVPITAHMENTSGNFWRLVADTTAWVVPLGAGDIQINSVFPNVEVYPGMVPAYINYGTMPVWVTVA